MIVVKSFSYLGYPVVVVTISDTGGQSHLLSCHIVSHETIGDFYIICDAVIALLEIEDNKLSPAFLMRDACDALFNFVSEKFPDSKKLICFFHVMLNVQKKCQGLNEVLREVVKEDIRRMAMANDQNQLDTRYEEIFGKWGKTTNWQRLELIFTKSGLW